ncbi:MAG: 16S rRNA (guanine(527)-N(7))-methyltransferase RsmG [Flavobacteriales bacterium]|nr:16S rRNA (guanine(527)-N(7))-methyltransferase RsmG [Flavobacteriales bacterium]
MTVISKYFPNLTARQQAQFAQLLPLYEEWNAQINVISRKDMESFYVHHVLHSLAIAKAAPFDDGTVVLDVGTGGGFPGIPLAIMFPNCTFHLVDSIGKKIKVVNGVAEALGLENVTAEQARVELLPHTYDVVVTRAVAPLSQLKQWLRGRLDPKTAKSVRGLLALKGGDLAEEMSAAKMTARIIPIQSFFNEDYFETKSVIWIKGL